MNAKPTGREEAGIVGIGTDAAYVNGLCGNAQSPAQLLAAGKHMIRGITRVMGNVEAVVGSTGIAAMPLGGEGYEVICK